MVRDFLFWFFNGLLKLLAKVTIIDYEHIPESGGFILVANHLGIIDPVLIFGLIKRKDVTGLVAKKHQKNPLFRYIVNSVGGIWLNREEADTHALRAAIEHLQRGGVLGIAPEGTRSSTGAMIPAKTGAAYLADRAGVPILPVAITGTYQGIQQLLHFHRPNIIVRFGKPFMLPKVPKENREKALKQNTDEIMCRIAAMLPPEYRGVYANHPRLRELLEEEQIKAPTSV